MFGRSGRSFELRKAARRDLLAACGAAEKKAPLYVVGGNWVSSPSVIPRKNSHQSDEVVMRLVGITKRVAFQ